MKINKNKKQKNYYILEDFLYKVNKDGIYWFWR